MTGHWHVCSSAASSGKARVARWRGLRRAEHHISHATSPSCRIHICGEKSVCYYEAILLTSCSA
eukprot:2359479-Prymnesium_polylepis.2